MDDVESVSSGEVSSSIVEAAATDLFIGLQVKVPDLNIEKSMQFHQDELIWNVKQHILSTMPKELPESFNYGLYLPGENGKAGKFIDEERRLSEYNLPNVKFALTCIELKYKKRVYKAVGHFDTKQFKSVNSKANLRKFLDHVSSNHVEKVNKMCAKGLDPNFHCSETRDTPLCIASTVKVKPSRMVIALVNGGAILDFRRKDGSTPMHVAVTKNNIEVVRTLLDLGASPNYKDGKGLTPLYACLFIDSLSMLEMLLKDRAVIGACDVQGWQEVHQACKNGLVQHLEQLLFYGADINAQNASGNTPLHVCAVNNKESCARLLLFRGADRDVLNYAGQTPYQVAVIAASFELAEVIQRHRPEDVVFFKESPTYNSHRKDSGTLLRRTISNASCTSSTFMMPQIPFKYGLRRGTRCIQNFGTLSPSPPFSSGGSSLSETTSTGSGCSTGRDGNILSVIGHGPEYEQLDSASTLAVEIANSSNPICNDMNNDVCSLSSGVYTTSGSGSTEGASSSFVFLPGTFVVCLENYSSSEPGRLNLTQGDIIEVTAGSCSDINLVEGVLGGEKGLFPACNVREVRLRNPGILKQALIGGPRVQGRRESTTSNTNCSSSSYKKIIGQPLKAVLNKGKKGFGFVLRGAKATSPLIDMIPSEKCPGLQYMDDVDAGSVAEQAGIKKGDFLLSINGEDVTKASHETVVDLIRKSGESLILEVIGPVTDTELKPQATSPPVASYDERRCFTLPRRMHSTPAPPPPKRNPSTTLSVGRARAKSMLASLSAIEILDQVISEHDSSTSESITGSVDSVLRHPEFYPDTNNETDKSERTSNNCVKIPHVKSDKTNVYSSVAEMKRLKKQSKSLESHSSVVLPSTILHKSFHSNPDLATTKSTTQLSSDLMVNKPTTNMIGNSSTLPSTKSHLNKHRRQQTESAGPAPTHPPPPLPDQVDTKKNSSLSQNDSDNYAMVTPRQNIVSGEKGGPPMSSFKPSDNAKLYASPQNVRTIVYRSSATQSLTKKRSPTARAHSMPPQPYRQPMPIRRQIGSQNGSNVDSFESYSVNGVCFTTNSTFQSSVIDENPIIPEPDYDHDEDEEYLGRQITSLTSSSLMAEKKKKSVSFDDGGHHVTPNKGTIRTVSSGDGKYRPNSILKDSSTTRSFTDDDWNMQKIPLARLKPTNSTFLNTEKILIEVPPPVPQKATGGTYRSIIQKSLSFCTEKNPLKSSICSSPTLKSDIASTDVSGSTISEGTIRHAKSQLKPSKSCPNEFNNEDAENSSSGVSSDQDTCTPLNASGQFVTYLPIDGPSYSRVHDADSMKQFLHPKLAAIFDLPKGTAVKTSSLLSGDKRRRSSSVSSSNSLQYQTLPSSLYNSGTDFFNSVERSESSIDHSLDLIQKHISNLGGVGGNMSLSCHEAIAPPPGFSDSESYSDSESSNVAVRHKFGFSSVSKSRFPLPVTSLTDQLKFERRVASHANVDKASFKSGLNQTNRTSINVDPEKFSCLSTTPTFQTSSNSRISQFRFKPLFAWSTVDVSDWLESLALTEYKGIFARNSIDGCTLSGFTRKDFENLGISRPAHLSSVEKSFKRFLVLHSDQNHS